MYSLSHEMKSIQALIKSKKKQYMGGKGLNYKRHTKEKKEKLK